MINPLIVLTGKTASGKDTVMSRLLFRWPDFKRVITTTSRVPRSGEKNGVDYSFLSRDDFNQKVEAGDFIEYVSYGGNLYGTEKTQIINNLDRGLIWRIDPSRAGQIKELIKSSFEAELAESLLKRVLVIYLTVDDSVVLKRLQKRDLSKEEIDKRMQEDKQHWQQYQDNYDFVVENMPGKLDETIDKVIRIIENSDPNDLP